MTKKDYKLIAQCLRDALTLSDAIRLLSTVLALHNPQFNQQLFLDACAKQRTPK